jgi:5-methyltetrahydrofolate--homocysteine methyltransferase
MKNFSIERLDSEILICDGAMGTMLSSAGFPPGESPEKWGLQNETKLRAIHEAYVKAGADIILTNTFGANAFKLAKFGLADEVDFINQAAVEIAVSVAGEKGYVAGDIGPSGEFMEPLGLIAESQMRAAFAQQAKALADGGVDLIIIETMMDLNEMKTAIRAAKSSTDLIVIALMSFNTDRHGFRTMMGVSPTDAAFGMLKAGADIVGANCGSVEMKQMPELIAEMKAAGAQYIIVEPNAGAPQMVDGETVFPQTPDEMAAGVPEVVKAGANIIGGCCGTTPEHIKAISNLSKIITKSGMFQIFSKIS